MLYFLGIWAAIATVIAINANSTKNYFKALHAKEAKAHRETERRYEAYSAAADECGAELTRSFKLANDMYQFAYPRMNEADPDWAFRANCPNGYDRDVKALAHKVNELRDTFENYSDVFYFLVGERIKEKQQNGIQ